MFTWDKSLQKIDVPAAQVVNLYRSMRDVQLALPGLPVQQAGAYLCQYRSGSGIATVAVFHLQKSRMLAFYRSDPATVPEGRAESLLDQGLGFVESMGFLLSDMDLHLLGADDLRMLWDSLPLRAGLEPPAEAGKPAAKAGTPDKSAAGTDRSPGQAPPPPAKASAAPPVPAAPPTEPPIDPAQPATRSHDAAGEPVDDLLAAVEALRGKRPAMRVRRKTPKPAEIEKRRQELRENLGRILASL